MKTKSHKNEIQKKLLTGVLEKVAHEGDWVCRILTAGLPRAVVPGLLRSAAFSAQFAQNLEAICLFDVTPDLFPADCRP